MVEVKQINMIIQLSKLCWQYGKLHFNIGTIQLEYHIIPKGRKKSILIHFVRACLASYTRIVALINQE